MKRFINCISFLAVQLAIGISATRAAASIRTLDYPLATETYAEGISGTNIVGWYRDSSSGVHGFLFDGSTYKTLPPAWIGLHTAWYLRE